MVAGGLHAEIKDKYFRIGCVNANTGHEAALTLGFSHMGLTVVDKERGDVDRVVESLKEVVTEAKVQKGL